MSGVTIRNPGSGRQAFVSKDGQLLTQSQTLSLQHWISRYRGQTYQVLFTDAGIQSGTNNVGFIRNTSPTLSLVMTYVRLQAVDLAGGTAPPAADNYWSIAYGNTYESGGSLKTAVNSNRRSGNAASVVAYDTNPTLAGTAVEFDRYYVDGESQVSFNKEGAVILGTDDTLTFRLITDNTSGLGYARLTFLMMDLTDVQ